jgi:hypothetical protein
MTPIKKSSLRGKTSDKYKWQTKYWLKLVSTRTYQLFNSHGFTYKCLSPAQYEIINYKRPQPFLLE